jgi:hypothetical protein
LTFEIDPLFTAVDSAVRLDNLSFVSKCSVKSNVTRTVQFASASVQASEASGVAVIEVRLSEPAEELVTVEFATSSGSAKAGIDYTETKVSLNFNPGDSVVFVSIPLQQDAQPDEGIETVKLTLKLPRGAKLGKLKSAMLQIFG